MVTEKPVLKEPDQYPTEDVIYSCIGKKKALWISFFNTLHEQHPDFSKEWRYYNDGKNWLMKVTRKSKTIFWLSVWKNAFKITFYLSDKAEESVSRSDLPDALKKDFKNGKRYGKIRGLTIAFSKKKDIEYAESLIAIRCKN
ncbi:MAG: DUF3788 domain-containing protein [Sedimentisphaerales bacterium]|nr:DUF3788 domain-containing protein [Sedimentisphaerales bacterium]